MNMITCVFFMFLCKYFINNKFNNFVHGQWEKRPMGYLAFMHSACFHVLLIFQIQTNVSIEIMLPSVSPGLCLLLSPYSH